MTEIFYYHNQVYYYFKQQKHQQNRHKQIKALQPTATNWIKTANTIKTA